VKYPLNLGTGVLLVAIAIATPAAAQSGTAKTKKVDNPFFRTAIPKNVPSSFVYHQNGTEIVRFDGITSFFTKQSRWGFHLLAYYQRWSEPSPVPRHSNHL